jgi:pilus assembly protein CpaB
MKPARIAVICVAAVSAIGLALVVRAMGNASNEPTAPAAAAPIETRPMTRVLVAAGDLQPGKRLVEADMEWRDWPSDQVNPAFIVDGAAPPPPESRAEKAAAKVVEAAEEATSPGAKGDYVGAVVRETILKGEPIVTRKIVRAGDSGYMAAYLEPGMRAMAIRVTVESAAGGFILPGDRVDVIQTRELQGAAEGAGGKFTTATVMRNIKVLAIDQTTQAAEDETAVVGATATLEVGPSDAEALALAKSEGELSLMLRSYADTAGPSGAVRTGGRQAASAVRVYRGGQADVVSVQ